jgi:predicted ribonuclease YlaK
MRQLSLAEDCHNIFLKDTKLEYQEEGLKENEFVRINGHLGIYKEGSVKLCEIQPKNGYVVPIPKDNYPYLAAINACIDRSIPMVCIRGAAGTGKTICSLSGILYLWKFLPEIELIVIKENVMATEYPLGFNKGTLSEKKTPVFQYLRSALDFIKNHNISLSSIRQETLAYLLGETFSNSYVIVDEAQCLTRRNIDLLATRIGKNSKIIFLGDNDQNYGKSKETGLDYLRDIMDGSKYFVDVELTDSTLRGELVQEYLNRRNVYLARTG